MVGCIHKIGRIYEERTRRVKPCRADTGRGGKNGWGEKEQALLGRRELTWGGKKISQPKRPVKSRGTQELKKDSGRGEEKHDGV